MGSYAWHVGTLRDGRLTAELPAVQTSWSLPLDDAGPLSVSAVLSDPAVAALNLYTSAEPCRCFLAVAYTDDDGTETFLEGGPVWTHKYDPTTKQLQISATGLWSYYDHRKILPVLAAGVNPATIDVGYTDLSLATIAKRLLQLAHTHTAGSVPVVFAADEAGVNDRTFHGYEMNDVGPALRDLTATDGGPEIQFVPRRRADDPRFIEWVMRGGTTETPLLTQDGVDWIYDLTAPKSSATVKSVTRDGSQMADRLWVQGAGTDISTLFARTDDATLIAAGFPLLEQLDASQTTVTDQRSLNAAAAGGIKSARRPTETWSITVQRDEYPTVGRLRQGHWVKLTIPDSEPYLPAGTYRSRITQLSGDDSDQVQVDLAPTLGGI